MPQPAGDKVVIKYFTVAVAKVVFVRISVMVLVDNPTKFNEDPPAVPERLDETQ